MVYYGWRLNWSGPEMLMVLVWGFVVAGVAVTLASD
jgi:hypothetical protein